MSQPYLRPCAFAGLHPAVTAAFFMGAVVTGLCLDNPICAVIGLVASYCCALSIRGTRCLKMSGALLCAIVVLALINALVNTRGRTVLFSAFGRPFTAEALLFGAMGASLFVTALMWMSSFRCVMGTEKLSYLGASRAPAITLICTMAVNFVSRYTRRIEEVRLARSGIGIGGGHSLRSRLRESFLSLYSLTGWAFESSVTTADSMRSRGYGTGARTSYRRYRFTVGDGVYLAFIAVCVTACMTAYAHGCFDATWFPSFAQTDPGVLGVCGYCLYGCLCFSPVVINSEERLRWRFSN